FKKKFIKMVKLGFLAALVTLLLGVSYSFAGVIPSKNSSKSIGNYGVNVENVTVPDGSCYKFHLYVKGYIWYICTSGSWQTKVVYYFIMMKVIYPAIPLQLWLHHMKSQNVYYQLGATGVRSIIPECDTSYVVLTNVYSTPSPDPECDFPYGLESASGNGGDGAFKDVNYNIRANTKGGVPPQDAK
ncbi:14262_t:CDS:2, partial [Dentiscutata erythropus]